MSRFLTCILLSAFAASSVLAGQCPECWEQCFNAPTSSLADEYAEILNMITSLRAAKSAAGTDATHFAFDATESDPNRYKYQKALAAIAAVALDTDPGAPCENPLYVATYYTEFAVSTLWCQDKCDMAAYITSNPIMNMYPQTPSNSFQVVSLACLINEVIMRIVGGPACPAQDRDSLLVKFTNGPYSQLDWPLGTFTCNNNDLVKSVVETGDDTLTPSPGSVFPEPNSLYFQIPYDDDNEERLDAAVEILDCISEKCCSGDIPPPLQNEATLRRLRDNAGATTLYVFRQGLKEPEKINVRSEKEAVETIQKLAEEDFKNAPRGRPKADTRRRG